MRINIWYATDEWDPYAICGQPKLQSTLFISNSEGLF